MAKARKETVHPAEQYARDVVSGKIVAGKWIKLACARHLHDLVHGYERGLYFDADAAQRAIRFISMLRQSKGKWGRGGGQPLILEPWQQFIVWNAFGWIRDNGFRRFRTIWLEVGRKNGKSTLGAAIGLYLAFADNEPAAEVYSVSTKRDQSRIVHAEAIRFVRKNPILKKHVKIYKDNLSIEQTASKYMPLGGDSDSTDGLNVHGVIADEIHQWKSREMWEVMETATGSREQPMFVAITTAGVDRTGICWEKHAYTQKILTGWEDKSYEDDSWFGMIYSLDEEDDWRDESCWIKSNPNLGVSKYLDDLQMKAKRAGEMTAALNNFLRRELNVWVHGATKWMNMDKWRECAGDVPALEMPDHLEGATAYCGLDLSSTSDITAFVMVFLDEDDNVRVVPRFWIPEDQALIRTRDQGVKYQQWIDEGYIESTPGNVLDYDWVYESIERDAKQFNIDQIAFDPWGASRVVQDLEKRGFQVVTFRQGGVSMNPPMQELERAVLKGKIIHGNNPVLTWMADNLVARVGPTGLLKPDKAKSTEKIDGMVALLMALDLALRHPETKSVYETRGIRTL